MKIKTKMSRAVFASAAAATVLLTAACSGGALGGGATSDSEGPIKIGLLLPTSGVYAPISDDMIAGFELYLEQNDNKMGGREVVLIIEDTEATPETGLRKANKLLQEDEVDFGSGIVSSAVALQVAGAFEAAEVPLVVSNAVANAVTGDARSDFVFRTAQSSHQLSYPVGEWIHEELNGVPLFLTASDYAAGHELVDGVREGYIDAGGSIAGEAFPPFQKTQDYQPYISQIGSSGAEATYAFFAGGEAVNFVKQYDEFGYKNQIPLIGPGSLTTPDVLSAQGESAEGAYSVLPYAWTLDNEINAAFVTDYRQKTDRAPSYFSLFSYDAAQLIAQAVQELAGDTSDGAALAAAMEGTEIDSPRGRLLIDKETHGTVQTMYLARIENLDGELAPVIVGDLGEFGEQP
ncbi:branched-chain amino acid transport system substrate-binding protein [Cryobacterium flavum]|uniref:ABC transporter substrate-binding protein n=1 Tax=Cryobacterium flavum TaxID=1424659 RepID=A0A4R8V666_9MICO|nr:ABC transporter substrate-binding protein [Cryobacterium flavum]TFB77977.1 ABC transporter substrate-binding protein [Cryobacterium flavum]SDO24122.1 branched-chain amino acid transport system substrate-binding protein [Cryobacterium flavum]